ncbi:hypothetical protein, partial [Stenotrophomonas maltophilia]|uniref:hypothetical protein n=1 Tax=Stenotrophomonas maltophilia TaxID=40324 RepID=UPI001EF90D19
ICIQRITEDPHGLFKVGIRKDDGRKEADDIAVNAALDDQKAALASAFHHLVGTIGIRPLGAVDRNELQRAHET